MLHLINAYLEGSGKGFLSSRKQSWVWSSLGLVVVDISVAVIDDSPFTPILNSTLV